MFVRLKFGRLSRGMDRFVILCSTKTGCGNPPPLVSCFMGNQLFLTGYDIGRTRMLTVSMQKSDKALQRVATMAKEFGCGIVISFPERPRSDKRVMFIAAMVFDSDGKEVALYVHPSLLT